MSLTERDLKVIWHPYTQMKTAQPPVGIIRGEGALLFDEEGKQYIDAVSSWWVNIHGHAHPYIAKKVSEQLYKLEHVILLALPTRVLLSWPNDCLRFYLAIKKKHFTLIMAQPLLR
jgi:adenosylmethionine-8-amino-7-oxononanoate aminotransferase